MSRGHFPPRLVDMTIRPEEVTYLDPPLAVEEIDRVTKKPRRVPGTRRGRSRRPAGDLTSPRPVRDLSEDQVQRLRSEWATGIVRPHRKPWQPVELDLADCPCSCTSTTACLWHKATMGGPRPFARS
jgi:hypothetical protein